MKCNTQRNIHQIIYLVEICFLFPTFKYKSTSNNVTFSVINCSLTRKKDVNLLFAIFESMCVDEFLRYVFFAKCLKSLQDTLSFDINNLGTVRKLTFFCK